MLHRERAETRTYKISEIRNKRETYRFYTLFFLNLFFHFNDPFSPPLYSICSDEVIGSFISPMLVKQLPETRWHFIGK